ncbi:MAG: MiaB/RimO family radical SAM methylthiotransferase, partial [Bacilli bacterium]|nr:MiaB/RimO family radical SAM methylthiotransferase [Bacilli bacterium]
ALFAKVLGDSEEGIAPLNPLRREISTPDYSAYLRISEGCNNFCSFCAIPYIRGRFVSRPYDEIIEEAKLLKERGIKEISVISQDTMHYGCDFEGMRPNIVDLMKELDGMGFYSIRLLYLYPEEIPDEMIDLIAESKSIKHYFDIPVQCASDHLLKLMNRHGTKEEMMRLFRTIKEKVPDAILRTTLIAGFPGESEEDFEETIEFLKEVKFDHMGCFAYSREEGTAGAKMKNQVPDEVKEERRAKLMGLQRKISYDRNKAHIGEVMEGIVVGRAQNGDYLLRSSWNAPDEIDGNIYFKSKRDLANGEIVKVKINRAFVYDLMGEEEE